MVVERLGKDIAKRASGPCCLIEAAHIELIYKKVLTGKDDDGFLPYFESNYTAFPQYISLRYVTVCSGLINVLLHSFYWCTSINSTYVYVC